MAEMTAADHNIICELKLSARPDQFELLRHVLGIIEQQAQEIAKRGRMLDKACEIAAQVEGICLDADGLRRWIEQEVAG